MQRHIICSNFLDILTFMKTKVLFTNPLFTALILLYLDALLIKQWKETSVNLWPS